jgi:hypothetical protein
MPVFNNMLAGASGGAGAGGYEIERSLRFNSGDSAYLSKNFASAGNRKTWTWSGWVKRSGNDTLFDGIFAADNSVTNRDNIKAFFYNDNDLYNPSRFVIGDGSGAYLRTTQSFRDFAAWGHLLIIADTTLATANDRIKIYWNGVRITEFAENSLSTKVPQNSDLGWNTSTLHVIGANKYNNTTESYLNGYLADVHFIDGQALAPADFGETDDNGVWQPKEFAGTYGPLVDTSQTWSNIATLSGGGVNSSHPLTQGFNGNLNNRVEGDTNGEYLEIPISTTIASGGVRVYAAIGSTTPMVINLYNGSSNVHTITSSTPDLRWHTTSYAGPITKIRIERTSRPFEFNAVEVNGKILVDSGVTVTDNSFYLPFTDNSSNAALGTDTSGNSNTWTVNNLSVAGSSWNQSQTWSSSTFFNANGNAFYSTDMSEAELFDNVEGGSGSNGDYPLPEVGGTFTLTFTQFSSASTVTLDLDGAGNGLKINGSFVTITNNYASTQTFNVSGLTSIEWLYADGTNYCYLGSVTVDGVKLVDSGISDPLAAGIDSLRDSPSQIADQTDTGVGGEVVGNYCTWNPLVKFTGVAGINQPTEYSNGNLQAKITTGGTWTPGCGTIAVNSDKWYAEFEVADKGGANHFHVGINPPLDNFSGVTYHSASNSGHWYGSNGELWNAGSATGAGSYATVNNGDIIGIALDFTASTVTFYKNGSSLAQVSLNSNITTHGAVFAFDLYPTCTVIANFGQRAFAYTAPSGYKSLNTANLPTPTIADGSKYFDTNVWNGDGTSNRLISTNFSPDFTWMKIISQTGQWHLLANSVRGGDKTLSTNNTLAENTRTGFVSFDSNGFTIGDGNSNPSGGEKLVGWAWDAGDSTVSNTNGTITSQVRASVASGFSIVTWTGDQNKRTIGHGLNKKPDLIIWKSATYASNWAVWHSAFSDNEVIFLNNSAAKTGNSDYFDNTAPTSTVFPVDAQGNKLLNNLALVFTSVEGYSAFGSYTGNSSTDGPFIALSFRPKWLLIREITSGTNSWQIQDAERDPYNVSNTRLVPNSTAGDSSNAVFNLDMLSNGFKLRTSNDSHNSSSYTYIWAAFAEHPFKIARAR